MFFFVFFQTQNEGMEIERSNENVNTTGHHDAGQFIASAEAAQSQGRRGACNNASETTEHIFSWLWAKTRPLWGALSDYIQLEFESTKKKELSLC